MVYQKLETFRLSKKKFLEEDEEEDEGEVEVKPEDLTKIQDKISVIRNKLNEKTLRISELKQSLRHTKMYINQNKTCFNVYQT